MPELSSNVLANREITLSKETMDELEKVIGKVMKSKDPNA